MEVHSAVLGHLLYSRRNLMKIKSKASRTKNLQKSKNVITNTSTGVAEISGRKQIWNKESSHPLCC